MHSLLSAQELLDYVWPAGGIGTLYALQKMLEGFAVELLIFHNFAVIQIVSVRRVPCSESGIAEPKIG